MATSEKTEIRPAISSWSELAPARLRVARRDRLELGVDAAVLVVAAFLADFSTRRAGGDIAWLWVAVYPVLVLGFLIAGKSHTRTLRPHVLDEIRVIFGRTALAAMILVTVRAIVEVRSGAAGETARQWLLAAACLAVARVVPAYFQLRANTRAGAGISTLIVGAGQVGQLVSRRLRQYPELGLQPIGFLDDAPLSLTGDLPVLGGLSSFERVVHQYGAERVIVAFSPASHEELLEIIRRSQELGLEASFVPRLFETVKEKVRIDFVGSLPLVAIEPTNPRAWRFTLKYAVDRVLAAILILLMAPLFVVIGLAVWLSLGRPILFRQPRVGRDGRVFEMLKFRTMNGKGEPVLEELPPDTAPGGVEGDDRRTGVGRFLRRSSLDELPQLVNVLRSEMSLVGPRPERPEFADRFEQSVHRYSERQRVKAGITGWAQIHGLRGKTSLADRAEWDNYYIDNWSVWLDFKILMLTVLAVARFQSE